MTDRAGSSPSSSWASPAPARARSAACSPPGWAGPSAMPTASTRPPMSTKMSRGEPLTDADRWPWLDAIGAVDRQATSSEGGVVTCSALKRIYRERLLDPRPAVRLVHLSGDPALIGARQAARPDHFMPPSLMASQFATLEAPAPEERAIILSVAPSPAEIAASIAVGLGGLAEHPRPARRLRWP